MRFAESENVELKKSTSELKEGIISLVAMLNKHHRGELWFGVRNDGIVVGQSVSEKSLREVSRAISDNVEPKVYPTIEQALVDGKQCIRVMLYGGLTIDTIRKKMVSARRNELLAELFHRVHLIEKWGRGGMMILEREPDRE